MEDHQELEKPVFEFLHHRKLRSSRKKKKNRFGESRNDLYEEEIFFFYGLKESPKKSLRSKKRLVRCGECGKGFRYEKCLRNHSQTMHSSEEKKKIRRDLLCFFVSGGVQRRKRSKRVSRFKKSLPPPALLSVSSSSSVANDGELLEVAESLIMLSKSGDALFSNLEMNEKVRDGSLRISTESDGTAKELLGFLGDKKQEGANSFGEQVRSERDRPGLMLRKAETETEEKLGGQEAASKGFQMNNEHRCRLCERVFSTYQALGGHQTFHRMKNSSEKSKPHEMQRRVKSRS